MTQHYAQQFLILYMFAQGDYFMKKADLNILKQKGKTPGKAWCSNVTYVVFQVANQLFLPLPAHIFARLSGQVKTLMSSQSLIGCLLYTSPSPRDS